jgi:NTE family protein
VLDYLLEDERIDIEGISGASAGAMNAVMLADGLARGGAAEARKRLDSFWRAASHDGESPGAPARRDGSAVLVHAIRRLAGAAWFDAVARYMSPYDLNPLNINRCAT